MPSPRTNKHVTAYLKSIGSKGGSMWWKKLTPEQRQAATSKAGRGNLGVKKTKKEQPK